MQMSKTETSAEMLVLEVGVPRRGVRQYSSAYILESCRVVSFDAGVGVGRVVDDQISFAHSRSYRENRWGRPLYIRSPGHRTSF